MATKPNPKIKKVMDEWKAGTLNSGKNGPIVKNQKQAVAIALNSSKPKKKTKTGY